MAIFRATARASAAIIVAATVACATLAETARNTITFDDMVSLVEMTELDIARDATKYVYVTRSLDIGVVTQTGGEWIARTVARGHAAKISPDGQTLAYLDPRGHLHLLELSTGAYRPLLDESHKPRTFSWSPTGEEIVFSAPGPAGPPSGVVRAVPAEGSPLILSEQSPAGWALAGLRLGSEMPVERGNERLCVVGLRDGAVRELPIGRGRNVDPDWSHDDKIAYVWKKEGPIGLNASSEVRTFDMRTGEVRTLVKVAGEAVEPRWSPDGTLVAFRPGPAARERMIRVASWDGTERRIPAPPGTYEVDFAWFDSQRLAILSARDAAIQVLLLDVESGRRNVIAAEFSVARNVCVAHGVVSWVESSGSAPSQIRQRRLNGESNTVFDPNPKVAGWVLGHQETIHYRNQHGFERTGVLITPPNARPGDKFPLVVSCYPHPFHPNGFQFQWAGYADQTWVSRGYAVFYPRPHMPKHWYSASNHPAERESLRGPKGWDVTVDDVLSGVDEVIRRGTADPERMGLLGHSNGGEVVAFLITSSHRFKCAALLSPVGLNYVDWALYEDVGPLEEDGARERAIWTESVGSGTLWENPRAFIDFSSVFRFDRVRTPVLIAVGDRDTPVCLPATQAFLALRRHGCKVTFLRYEGQGHVLVGSAHRDFATRTAAFFDRYLCTKVSGTGQR